MKDLKEVIIKHLSIIRDYEKINGNTYKYQAYTNVLTQLYNYNKPIYKYDDFIANIKAGDRINAKIEELILTGKITYEEENITNNNDFNFQQQLKEIHGIGTTKIKEIISNGINNLEDLYKNKHLLNKKQQIGLFYYNDLKKRIPLREFLLHKKKLEKDLKGFIYEFVGSYRRKSETMGDIDLLIMNHKDFNLNSYIKKLKQEGYIKEVLSLGKMKFSGIVRYDDNNNYPYRQLDILISPPEEYYYALIHFTGSGNFNIGMRNFIKSKYGVSLSEHGIRGEMKDKRKVPKEIKNEKEIFNFFNIKYTEPKNRKIFIS